MARSASGRMADRRLALLCWTALRFIGRSATQTLVAAGCDRWRPASSAAAAERAPRSFRGGITVRPTGPGVSGPASLSLPSCGTASAFTWFADGVRLMGAAAPRPSSISSPSSPSLQAAVAARRTARLCRPRGRLPAGHRRRLADGKNTSGENRMILTQEREMIRDSRTISRRSASPARRRDGTATTPSRPGAGRNSAPSAPWA